MKHHYNFGTFLEELPETLRTLPHERQLAFAASCCERAFPNYVAFSKQEDWGDPRLLRMCLDRVWSFIEGNYLPEAEAREMVNQCRAMTPDSDDFPSGNATAAQEAALMVILLLQLCHDKMPDHAVGVATFARDTVDMYVAIEHSPDPARPQIETREKRMEMESVIRNHPLTRAELERQQEDLRFLLGIQEPGQILTFESQARSVSKSSIGL